MSSRKRVLLAYYTEPFSVPADCDVVETQMGIRPDAIMWFISWSNNFPLTTLQNITARGQLPILTWQPSIGGGTPSTNANILAGLFDTTINTFVDNCKLFELPMVIRLGHEMNGVGWYQWQDVSNFADMWRYVWNKFKAKNVKNVSWFWCPNKIFTGSLDLASMYPGDDYVDIVGLDAYNRGNPTTAQYTPKWDNFDDLFPPTIQAIRAITSNKPLWIGETGCPEFGGSKADWFKDLFYKARIYSIEGVTYFNTNKVSNPAYKIDTTPESLAAFQSLTPIYF